MTLVSGHFRDSLMLSFWHMKIIMSIRKNTPDGHSGRGPESVFIVILSSEKL